MKLYTKEQLINKYAGRFINTRTHHYEQRDSDGKYITVYEVLGVSKIIKENFESPEEV